MKNTKTYEYDGKKYKFNHQKFSNLLDELAISQNKKTTSISFLMTMEEKLYVSGSTIKSWKYENNSPSTLKMVETLANLFCLKKTDLLIEMDGNPLPSPIGWQGCREG